MENNAFNKAEEELSPCQSGEIVREDTVGDTEEENTNKLLYSIENTPAWYTCVVLGVQHYLVAIGSTIGIPLILAPNLCIPNDEEGDVARALLIGSLFFVSGICTVLQTTLGIRLPILQGGTFSYLPPTLAILALPHNQCPNPLPSSSINSSVTLYNDTDGSIVDGTELWQRRMREVQGAIAVASVLQLILGMSGAVGVILRFVGPLTIAPAVALVGLNLFSAASYNASPQWGIAIFTASIVIISSQYLKNVNVPIPMFTREKKCHFSKVALFKLLPVSLALILGWLLSLIFTATNIFPNNPSHPSYRARTDFRSNVITNSPWFYWPYPGQWGLPKVTAAGVVGMIAGVFAGLVESIGDYYACAKLSGAPNPPDYAINRGVLVEGFGCILGGVIGTGSATTSYSENIGAIGITRVGSRRVLQVAGLLFILLGMLSKFGSIFVSIPDPVVGGLFCVTFGLIAAVGISNLQYVDMNSPRNLFIFGFAFFMGLCVPEWMKANPGIIQTGSVEADQIITVLLQTSMLLGGLLGFVLDNTIPGEKEANTLGYEVTTSKHKHSGFIMKLDIDAGTAKERGIDAWRKTKNSDHEDEEGKKIQALEDECYALPFPTACWRYSRYVPFLPEYGKTDKIGLKKNPDIEVTSA